MEKYSKAVSEMYSQFKHEEAHPLEKYIGRSVMCYGEKVGVVGYCAGTGVNAKLIVDASKFKSWSYLEPQDVVFKECKGYLYVSISDLLD